MSGQEEQGIDLNVRPDDDHVSGTHIAISWNKKVH